MQAMASEPMRRNIFTAPCCRHETPSTWKQPAKPSVVLKEEVLFLSSAGNPDLKAHVSTPAIVGDSVPRSPAPEKPFQRALPGRTKQHRVTLTSMGLECEQGSHTANGYPPCALGHIFRFLSSLACKIGILKYRCLPTGWLGRLITSPQVKRLVLGLSHTKRSINSSFIIPPLFPECLHSSL